MKSFLLIILLSFSTIVSQVSASTENQEIRSWIFRMSDDLSATWYVYQSNKAGLYGTGQESRWNSAYHYNAKDFLRYAINPTHIIMGVFDRHPTNPDASRYCTIYSTDPEFESFKAFLTTGFSNYRLFSFYYDQTEGRCKIRTNSTYIGNSDR